MTRRRKATADTRNGTHGSVTSPPQLVRERTLVLHPQLRRDALDGRAPEARLDEAVGLARAIDLDIVTDEVCRIATPRPATYLGRGAVEAWADHIADERIDVAVIDAALSPVQQRNLERAWNCKVIDRTGLILEIFGERARTKEGALQVELAHLSYQKSRLVRSWTHLERQRGGFGFLGGPGETQIEADRRQIDTRIRRIERDLNTVRRTRDLHRKARRRVPYPVVALVGYTNAGKSTLFNRVTRADVLVEDLLFATLDPTMRAVELPANRTAIFSDTVGFVSDLPTDLVAAFRATLEEVVEADIVVHVRDISHPDTEEQKRDVLRVLQSLGVTEERVVLIEALNKIDLLSPQAREFHLNRATRGQDVAGISALTGEGIDDLLALIAGRVNIGREIVDLTLSHADGAGLAWLYRHGDVMDRAVENGQIHLRVALDPADLARYERRNGQAK